MCKQSDPTANARGEWKGHKEAEQGLRITSRQDLSCQSGKNAATTLSPSGAATNELLAGV